MISDIRYGSDESCTLDIYLPAKDAQDVFVYFHGGGMESGDKAQAALLAQYLTARGTAVVSANYRMYPGACFPQFVEDAAQAVAWTIGHGRDYGNWKRIFVGGSSAGGYLSMMLCFDSRFLKASGVAPEAISGYVHDAGQPTAHFNVLRERGIDSRRVIVDETAPLYFVGMELSYPPMTFIVSDRDMAGRYEQTMLMEATLNHFGFGKETVKRIVMHGNHCHYVSARDEKGESVLGKIIFDFISEV